MRTPVESNMNHKQAKRVVFGFLALAILSLSAAYKPMPPANAIRTIVIDAGHGGKDPGNLGTGRFKATEKNITLEVALKLGEYIKQNMPDVKVVYTRKDDSFPTLQGRVEIANKNQADLFISIHCDAFTKPTAIGSGTYVMGMHKTDEALRSAMRENASIYLEDNYEERYVGFDPKDPDTYIALSLRQNVYLDQSLNLSKRIQDQFRDKVGRVDRGVRQAGYYVISFTTMPSVLVEMGFLTNPDEEEFLNSEEGKTQIASALFRAIRDYKAEVEGKEIIDSEPIAPKAPKPKTEAKEETKAEKKDINQLVTREAAGPVFFTVQILTSSQPVERKPAMFKGLAEVDEYISPGVWRYAAGRTTSRSKASEIQTHLRKAGFEGAFVIAIKNGERISPDEAEKELNKK
jgi:N-acetylmuramoyl-L-alanine amidase